MNIEPAYGSEQPRHKAWLTSGEITEGQDGAYTINNATDAARLGNGSEIVVMDMPGTILFWDKAAQKAYVWSTAEV